MEILVINLFSNNNFTKNPDKGGSPAKFNKFNKQINFNSSLKLKKEEIFWTLSKVNKNKIEPKNTP